MLKWIISKSPFSNTVTLLQKVSHEIHTLPLKSHNYLTVSHRFISRLIMEKEGTVLTDSAKVAQWGAPTLDVWVVRKDFAEQHPDVVKAFAKSAIDAQRPYIENPDEWLKQPDNLNKLSRLSGVPEADVPGLVKGNTYLTTEQQIQQLSGPVNKAILDTAQFLKEQGKVPAVASDYSQFVTDRFVK